MHGTVYEKDIARVRAGAVKAQSLYMPWQDISGKKARFPTSNKHNAPTPHTVTPTPRHSSAARDLRNRKKNVRLTQTAIREVDSQSGWHSLRPSERERQHWPARICRSVLGQRALSRSRVEAGANRMTLRSAVQ